MSKINLLQETKDALTRAGKTPADVQWVGILHKDEWRDTAPEPCSFTWAEFAAVANFVYDNGYGGNEINGSLRVVGADWWLERGEFDGSEWWEFKTLPERPAAGVPTQATLGIGD